MGLFSLLTPWDITLPLDHDHDGHGGHSQDDADAVGGVPVRSRAELGGNSDDTSSASPLSHSRMIQIRSL